jgi:hypothetical protein
MVNAPKPTLIRLLLMITGLCAIPVGAAGTAVAASARPPAMATMRPALSSALPVRRAYDRFAYQEMFGSARAACSLLSEADIRRWLKRPLSDRGIIDAKNCVDGVTTLRRQTLAIHTNHCDGFTPQFLDANLSYSQRYITTTYTSQDVVRLHAGSEVATFADEGQTEVWTRTDGRWVLTSGPPPVFEPQC